MFIQFARCFIERIIRSAARRCGPHDLFNAYLRSFHVLSRHMVRDVALGDDADKF